MTLSQTISSAVSHIMTRDEYIQQVEVILSEHTARAASRLAAALALVPLRAQEAEIEIFVDQDGAGFLDVQFGLFGPDLFVLNQSIAEHTVLFGTHMTETGLDPPLPLMKGRGETFSVPDALTDSAASWVFSVWKNTTRGSFRLPVTVVSHDGYGTTTPFDLSL